MYALQRP